MTSRSSAQPAVPQPPISAADAKQRYMRLMVIHGVLMMLVGCLWGLLPRPKPAGSETFSTGNSHSLLFVAAHHQFTHQAEFTVALAFAFPLLRTASARVVKMLFLSTVAGMWCNCIPLPIMALTGQGSSLAPSVSSGLTVGVLSYVESALFLATAILDISALVGWLWFLSRDGGGDRKGDSRD